MAAAPNRIRVKSASSDRLRDRVGRPHLQAATGDLAQSVRRGRAEFLGQFPSIAAPDAKGRLPAPDDEVTFRACKLDWGERGRNADAVALYRDLLRLRRTDAAISCSRMGGVDGAVLATGAFVLRFFGREGGDDRLLLVNLGQDVELEYAAEPLLAPPARRGWQLLWSSEDPRYGGGGTAAVEREGAFSLPGESAVALRPAADE
jgi:maltooligosyltrehalose trehalohydrolase